MNVNNKKKFVLISVCVVLIFTIGGVLGNNIFADIVPKEERLKQLQVAEKEEKTKLEAMPNQTLEEIEKTVEQGHKVKEIGLEVGKLIEELAPPTDPKKELEDNIRGLKGVLAETAYFKTKVDDPIHGEMYKKGIRIVEQKKIDLAEIENDLKENKMPVEELIKKFENIRAKKVLE